MKNEMNISWTWVYNITSHSCKKSSREYLHKLCWYIKTFLITKTSFETESLKTILIQNMKSLLKHENKIQIVDYIRDKSFETQKDHEKLRNSKAKYWNGYLKQVLSLVNNKYLLCYIFPFMFVCSIISCLE
jgi:hypothetical protein